MMKYFTFDGLLAKLLFLVLAVIAVHYHIVAGVVVMLIFIYLSQNTIEGMEDMNQSHHPSLTNSSKSSTNIQDFKESNCVNGKLMKDNTDITPQEVTKNFPNIKFTGDVCNPCDEDCKFEIISSEEQISTQENLRPINSNEITIERLEAIKKK